MNFNDILNDCMQQVGCSARELCNKSGVSAAAISRYRSGERIPSRDSDTVEKLSVALCAIAKDKALTDFTPEYYLERLTMADDYLTVDSGQLLQNFDVLISALNISINRLCRHIHYDTSTIFRFRNGSRKLADPEKFAADVAGYIVRAMDSAQDRAILSELLGCGENILDDRSVCFEKVTEWLLSGKSTKKNPVSRFLNKFDEFDLNEYIKSIHFDEMKVPTAPFQVPTSKTYLGLKEMMESELDFLKATVFSKSMEPVTMYSNMPLDEMAKDPEFPKKWMLGMAMMLKKGLHLNQIHNVDRSAEEMMLGLEAYIPMYMTGQISPYYLKNSQNSVFLQLLKVSGAAALSGEAIAGYHEDGRYYLTKNKKEIQYYSRRAQQLLDSALPLMSIYGIDNVNELTAFLISDSQSDGKRRSILSTLPIYTMEEELLRGILQRNELTDIEIQNIMGYAAIRRRRIEAMLENVSMEVEISYLTETEFCEQVFSLDLSLNFCDKPVFYSYEEYLAHLKATERFAENHENYTLTKSTSQAFRNLQIHIHEGKWAMISKVKAPVIHFVIHHQKLVNAIENFIPPIKD